MKATYLILAALCGACAADAGPQVECVEWLGSVIPECPEGYQSTGDCDFSGLTRDASIDFCISPRGRKPEPGCWVDPDGPDGIAPWTRAPGSLWCATEEEIREMGAAESATESAE